LAEEENSHGRIPDSLEERFHPKDAKKRKVSRKDAKERKDAKRRRVSQGVLSGSWFLIKSIITQSIILNCFTRSSQSMKKRSVRIPDYSR
jgi:hypothetical protein